MKAAGAIVGDRLSSILLFAKKQMKNNSGKNLEALKKWSRRANYAAFATNLASSVFKKSTKLDKAGKLAQRAFVSSTAAYNAILGHERRDILYTLGNLISTLIGVIHPNTNNLYRDNAGVGIYNIANTIMNRSDRNESKFISYEESGKHYKDSLKKYLTYMKKSPIKYLIDLDSGAIGITGGIASLLGSSIGILGSAFKLKKLEKIAPIFRHFIGAFSNDLEKALPSNLLQGKKHYWLSGVGFAMGTLFDLLEDRSSNVVCDSLARMATGKSIENNEYSLPKRASKLSFGAH